MEIIYLRIKKKKDYHYEKKNQVLYFIEYCLAVTSI